MKVENIQKSSEDVKFICHCFSVSEKKIQQSIESGSDSVEKIRESCRASSGCGSCVDILLHLLAEYKAEPVKSEKLTSISEKFMDPGLNPHSCGYFGNLDSEEDSHS